MFRHAVLPLLALSAPAFAQTQQPVLNDLEKAFQKKMSGCKMRGFFTIDGRKTDKPREETYTIAKVEKFKGDKWTFYANIKYGRTNATLPIVVDVKWAGDTPVIQVTKVWFPRMGTYTARVLVYETHYAGFWSGGTYGGHMYGRIERASDKETEKVRSDAAKEKKERGNVGEGLRKKPAESGDAPKTGAKKKEASSETPVKKLEREPISKEENLNKNPSNWTQFRGFRARGIADQANYPTEWNVESGKNIRWKTKLPGLCHSSPVIYGDRIFVTTAVRSQGDEALTVGLYGSIAPVKNEGEYQYRVLCLDKSNGEILWSRVSWKGVPLIARHPKGSHAASSPCVDDKHVVAHFGSEGVYCYTHDGKFIWKRDLGRLDAGYFKMKPAQWGYASSPVIHDGKLLIQCDIQDQSFLTALDVKTGSDIWRTNRDEVPTWGSPTVEISNGRRQVLVNGWRHIGGYDLDTGQELWKCVGGGDIPVPTPIVGDDLIYITNAHGRFSPILAISMNATGEFSMNAEDSDNVVWSWLRRGNYMQTPIVHGGELYCCNDLGVITCIDAKTGERLFRERMGGGRMGFTSSGIFADGKLYFGSEDGEVHVLAAGREFKRLAINELGEEFMASPAASKGTLYFRTKKHLIAVGE